MRSLDRLQPLALLVLRLVLGIVLIVPRISKSARWRVPATLQFVGEASACRGGWRTFRLPSRNSYFGGMALIVAFSPRCFSVAVVIEMLVIIVKVEVASRSEGRLRIAAGAGRDSAHADLLRSQGRWHSDAVRGGGGSRGGRGWKKQLTLKAFSGN